MPSALPELPPGPLPRGYWQRYAAGLDPQDDWAMIYAVALEHEFPWDMEQSLSLALFRTFAVPEIGQLLDRTGEFTQRGQKRYDDTAIVLQEVGDFVGGESDDRTGVRRLNQMHGAYDIPNDQMIYVLATFVVVPMRWVDRYGYRPLSEGERDAALKYWQRVGRLMGIADIPPDLAGIEAYFDDYESRRFGYSDAGRRVADATIEVFASWYPAPLRGLLRLATVAMMDEPLRRALRYPDPPAWVDAAVRLGLRTRARLISHLPARRTRRRATDSPRLKGYPYGWDIARVGTFPPAQGGAPGEPGAAPMPDRFARSPAAQPSS